MVEIWTASAYVLGVFLIFVIGVMASAYDRDAQHEDGDQNPLEKAKDTGADDELVSEIHELVTLHIENGHNPGVLLMPPWMYYEVLIYDSFLHDTTTDMRYGTLFGVDVFVSTNVDTVMAVDLSDPRFPKP